MKLWELIEELNPSEIKDIEMKLNRQVYMPASATNRGAPVLKLTLPTNQHFGGRATGDNTDRFSHENDDFTSDEVEDLLTKAKSDPKLGYAKDLDNFASFPGPGDYPPEGHGYPIIDPKNNLKIPVVVKPNPRGKQLASKNTVVTDHGIEPRNLLKAKTIMFHRPRAGEKPPEQDRYAKTNQKPSYQLRPKSTFRPQYGATTRKRPDMTGYDDESTD